ncbi:MAG TPA: hypothetical protein VF834_15855 [Streptosporangiaceae bacterium]
MRIGAALVLIAIGAILRFALATVSIHGFYLHTIGVILMAVGVLGLILWLLVWAPWARGRSAAQAPQAYTRPDGHYEDGYPPSA